MRVFNLKGSSAAVFIVQKFPSNPMQELPQYQVLRKYAQQARIFENYPEEILGKKSKESCCEGGHMIN